MNSDRRAAHDLQWEAVGAHVSRPVEPFDRQERNQSVTRRKGLLEGLQVRRNF
jgi:hypothetical protein